MSDAVAMYQLQQVDLTWMKVARRLKQLMAQLGETEEVLKARSDAAATEATLHEWRAKQLDAELEGKTLAEKIEETEKRMMSGTVTDHRELENLQNSLDSLRRHRTQVEDTAVEAMMYGDEAEQKFAAQNETLADVESEWSAGQSDLRAEEAKLKQQYMLLKRKREALAKEMDTKLRQQYEKMRKRKSGIAITTVENGACKACNVQLPTGVVSGLNNATTLVICPSCGRYLFGG